MDVVLDLSVTFAVRQIEAVVLVNAMAFVQEKTHTLQWLELVFNHLAMPGIDTNALSLFKTKSNW